MSTAICHLQISLVSGPSPQCGHRCYRHVVYCICTVLSVDRDWHFAFHSDVDMLGDIDIGMTGRTQNAWRFADKLTV